MRTIAIVATAVLVGCAGGDTQNADDYATIIHFDTARIRLATKTDTLHLVVELAVRPDQHTMGLMERRTLPDSAGMLFVYSTTQPDTDAYWMFRTRIPLDIAFIDSAGTIRTTHRMEPCRSTLAEGCPTYPAGAPFRAALEVNAGYFDRHGVKPRDRVLLSDTTVHLPGR